MDKELLKRIKNCIPPNPYPEWLFPMTSQDYVIAIPDPKTRTAVSGFIGRWAYDVAKKTILEAIEDELEDE